MKTVLIIDDAGFDRTILGALLGQAGYDVIGEAASGKEGVELAKTLKPDLITLDKMMEDMDGMEVLKILKSEKIESKIVMISGDDSEQFQNEARSLGANDYFKKPIYKSDFKGKLDALFG